MQQRDLLELFGEDVDLIIICEHEQDAVGLRVGAVHDVLELPLDRSVVEVYAVLVVGHQRVERDYCRLLYVFAQEGRVYVDCAFHFIIFIGKREGNKPGYCQDLPDLLIDGILLLLEHIETINLRVFGIQACLFAELFAELRLRSVGPNDRSSRLALIYRLHQAPFPGNRSSLLQFYYYRAAMHKLQHSVAELNKIKNQIRVQLNQIRYPPERIHAERPTPFCKRIFPEKITVTSLIGPVAELNSKSRSKRLFPKDNLFNSDFNKSTQRRHYAQQFQDKVELSLPLRKRESSYLRCRTPPPQSTGLRQTSTSLWGIGSKDKSPGERGKRILHTYHVFKGDLI